MKKPDISFIIPTFNDETTIETVIHHIQELAPTVCRDHEILVINDASTDQTPAILERLAKRDSHLKIITHPINKGYGESIKELYYQASLTWLFSLPGDFQIHPKELLKFLPAMGTADMILGKRAQRRDNLKRQVQSKFYNLLLRIFFRSPITDHNSNRLMKTAIFKTIKLDSTSAFVDAELTLKAKEQGYILTEVPIEHLPRQSGSASGGKFFSTILPTIQEMITFGNRSQERWDRNEQQKKPGKNQ